MYGNAAFCQQNKQELDDYCFLSIQILWKRGDITMNAICLNTCKIIPN